MRYTVHNVEVEDFKNIRSLYNVKPLKILLLLMEKKKDMNKQQVLLSNCVQLQVKQNSVFEK